MSAKQFIVSVILWFLYVCAFAKLMPTYIDWLDSFFGRWSLWSFVIFSTSSAAITMTLVYLAYLLIIAE
jgi:hypothetical protein